jgi:hypothetical protein
MPTRNLGKTGYKVGIFSLGGQAALEKSHNEALAVPVIERALDLGVNYIDTSSIYGGPERWSEQYVGKVMKHRRSDAFLATKTKERTRDGSMRMIETSLKLLQTDHVDLWQLHDIGTMTDINEIFAKGGAITPLTQKVIWAGCLALGGREPPCGGPGRTGMLWRMVMVSSPIRTSFTTSRTMRWRSVILSVSAAPCNRARNAVRVSAKRRRAA